MMVLRQMMLFLHNQRQIVQQLVLQQPQVMVTWLVAMIQTQVWQRQQHQHLQFLKYQLSQQHQQLRKHLRHRLQQLIHQQKPADKPEDPASATDKGTSEAPQNSETPAVNVNGQPVVTVTPTAPVITAAGQTIVSTKIAKLLSLTLMVQQVLSLLKQ